MTINPLTKIPFSRPKVSDKVPVISITWKLGHTHAMTPFSDVEQMVREAIQRSSSDPADWTEEIIQQTVDYALWRHAYNRADYYRVVNADKRSRAVIIREIAKEENSKRKASR